MCPKILFFWWYIPSPIGALIIGLPTLYTYHIYILALHYITSHYMTLHDITWHDITLHDITWHYMTLHDITWHYSTLHDITWHYMTLHDITWHYMTLHEITWHYIHTHTCAFPEQNVLKVSPGKQRKQQPFTNQLTLMWMANPKFLLVKVPFI